MKLIDPIDIKQSIKDGQLEAFAARGKVYIKDVKSGDCVKILEELPSVKHNLQPNLQPTCNQLATEIIRCKDCKHRFLQNGIWQCPFTIPASENHFCGYAERRTDE